MKNTYRAITGRKYDLDALAPDERAFLRDVMQLYREKPEWADFAREWMGRGRSTLWRGKKVPVGQPVYRICQDLAARLGIAEGRLSPPDYRDRIADLIESRFRSRYEFCKKTGIDEGHLSRVLGSKKHLAPETLFRVLEVLGVEIELVERDEVYEQGAKTPPLEPDTTLERLQDVQRRIDRLLNLKARSENCPPAERVNLLGSQGLFADDLLDGLRSRVQGGEDFDAVLADAFRAALSERASLAKEVANEAVEAEKAHRRVAS